MFITEVFIFEVFVTEELSVQLFGTLQCRAPCVLTD